MHCAIQSITNNHAPRITITAQQLKSQ